jgi:hypothetical protein
MKSIDKAKFLSSAKSLIAITILIIILLCPVYILNNTGKQTEKTVYIIEVSRVSFISDKAMAYGICENNFISFHISPNDYILFKNNTFPLNEEYIISGKYSNITKTFNSLTSVSEAE